MSDKLRIKVGVGVMILRNNKVLLGKRHEDPSKADSELHGEGSWTMPGGGMDFGEDPEITACREVEEETGVIVEKNNLRLISVGNDKASDAHFITLGFLCEQSQGEPKVKEPDEITEWSWFSLDNLPSPLFFCSEKIIENYLNNRIY